MVSLLEIKIWNRVGDCAAGSCMLRLSGVAVTVDGTQCATLPDPATSIMAVGCTGTGTRLRLSNPSSVLTICEIEVY